AGGTESMSATGFYLSSRARWGYKLLLGSPEPLVDLMLYDGLTDPMSNEAMGEQAERLIAEHGISRGDLDEIAASSHQRAARAAQNGGFSDEIAPMELPSRGGSITFDQDEGVRPETTLESLSKLRPAFQKDGVLTAGNSSQISDGASALLLGSEGALRGHGLTPLARIVGSAWAAGEPWRFPEAPVPAVRKLLEKAGLTIGDFDLFENNEAFAVNNLLFNRMMGVPLEKLNVHGGAIALGHPIGASGARITTTLLHSLRLHNGHRGLAAICHGTGGGTALAIELITR
ncbi:MAG: thiolase family protein, partial [Rhodothermales bacterium]